MYEAPDKVLLIIIVCILYNTVTLKNNLLIRFLFEYLKFMSR